LTFSAACRLLFRKKDGGQVTFDELIETELSAQSNSGGDGGPVTARRTERHSSALRHSPDTCDVLHELVTNAVKYAHLKQPNGHLTIRWRQEMRKWQALASSRLEGKRCGDAALGCREKKLIERACPINLAADDVCLGSGWRSLHHFTSRL